MATHGEARWSQARQVARAIVNIKNALANIALEVMVMRMLRRLVARAFAGQSDHGNLTRIDQQLHVAINRGHAHRRHLDLRRIQHFLS